MSTLTSSLPGRAVLARSAWDDPSRVLVADDRGSYLVISSEDRAFSIGCPVRYLYEFDAALYDELCQASAAGDRQRLAVLWSSAKSVRDTRGVE